MLLKKLVQTTLVAAAAISMSSVAMAEVTTSLSGQVNVYYQQKTVKPQTGDSTTTSQMISNDDDKGESWMDFAAMYKNGDKMAKLTLNAEDVDQGVDAILSGSQKMGDYTLSGKFKINDAMGQGSTTKASVAQAHLATKAFWFGMGTVFDEFDGNQRGMANAIVDYSYATDTESYHDGFVFKYNLAEGMKLTFVQQFGESAGQTTPASSGYYGAKVFGSLAADVTSDISATALKFGYKKDAIDVIAMYAMGEAKGKTTDTSSDGYKLSANSMQLGFAFDAGMVKPFVNYSAVTVKETAVGGAGGAKKNGTGYNAIEVGADLDLGDGLGVNAVYSTKKMDDNEQGATTVKGAEYTSMSASIKKTIGAYYIGFGFGDEKIKDGNKTTEIAIKSGYSF